MTRFIPGLLRLAPVCLMAGTTWSVRLKRRCLIIPTLLTAVTSRPPHHLHTATPTLCILPAPRHRCHLSLLPLLSAVRRQMRHLPFGCSRPLPTCPTPTRPCLPPLAAAASRLHPAPPPRPLSAAAVKWPCLLSLVCHVLLPPCWSGLESAAVTCGLCWMLRESRRCRDVLAAAVCCDRSFPSCCCDVFNSWTCLRCVGCRASLAISSLPVRTSRSGQRCTSTDGRSTERRTRERTGGSGTTGTGSSRRRPRSSLSIRSRRLSGGVCTRRRGGGTGPASAKCQSSQSSQPIASSTTATPPQRI
jgi:hypothetical protein